MIEYFFYILLAAWVLFRLAIVAGVIGLIVLAIQVARGRW